MVALTASKNTRRAEGDHIQAPAAAGVLVYAGAMVMRDNAGRFTKGQVAAGLVGVGVASALVDNSAGAAGAVSITARPGVWLMENSGSAPINATHIGSLAYAVDDQTVASTNGSGTRSPAGVVHDVTENGVFVRFDEALTAAM